MWNQVGRPLTVGKGDRNLYPGEIIVNITRMKVCGGVALR